MKKPISAKTHGIIDYIFAAAQLALPSVLGTFKKARLAEGISGTGVLAYSLLTASPVGLKNLIPFKTHRTIDMAALTGLGILALTPLIRKDRKALSLHLALLLAGVTTVLLTDWEDGTTEPINKADH